MFCVTREVPTGETTGDSEAEEGETGGVFGDASEMFGRLNEGAYYYGALQNCTPDETREALAAFVEAWPQQETSDHTESV